MFEQAMGSVDAHPGIWAAAALASVMLLPNRSALGSVGSLVVLLFAYFAKGIAGSVLFFLMSTAAALAFAILPSLYFGAEVNKEPKNRGPIPGAVGGWIVIAGLLSAATLEALGCWHVYHSVGS
jgi:hypothetical protein